MNIIARVLLISIMLIPFAARTQELSLSKKDRDIIIQEVIKYFQNNPETLSRQNNAGSIKNSMGDLHKSAAITPWEGNPDRKFTILVFSDYGCKKCLIPNEVIDTIIKNRNDVLISYKDISSSNPDAVAASIDLISVFNSQGRDAWKKLRSEYLKNGLKPEDRIKAQVEAGISRDITANNDAKIALLKNREIAIKAGVSELPAAIIMSDNKVITTSGEITVDLINQAIEILDMKD